MHYHLGIRIYALYSVVASIHILGKIGCAATVRHQSAHGRRSLIYGGVAIVQVIEHARRCFIAHLHPCHVHTIHLECFQHVGSMFGHCIGHLVGCFVCLPLLWNDLFAWVCPPVGIVKIYHHFQSQILGSTCLLQHIGLVIIII